MARVLIVFASRHGQAQRIAQHVAATLRLQRHDVTVVDATSPPSGLPMLTFDAFVLAASVNYRRHQKAMEDFVRNHLFELRSAPSAFLSVSASAADHNAKAQGEAQKCIEEFDAETGWTPTATLCVAGALKYTQYPWPLRLMLRSLVKRTRGEHGGDLDTRRDYEYTDWNALDLFVEGFLEKRVTPSSAMLV